MVALIKLSFIRWNTAVHWASATGSPATGSRLVSFFRSFLTCGVAPPPSPLELPVVDEVSIVIDDPPPRDTKCAAPASPSGQPVTAAWRRCCSIRNRRFVPDPAHPIVVLFQSQELGKAALGFSVPMITGLLSNQYRDLSHLLASLIALALSVGFAATWNGTLLRGVYPRVASMLENIGVGSIFVAFFGLVASFLPASLMWASWLCCGLSCLPFFLSLLPPNEAPDGTKNRALV